MPKKWFTISSDSGVPLPENSGARIRIEFYDDKRPALRADLSDAEMEEFLTAHPFFEAAIPRPGRKRKRAEL